MKICCHLLFILLIFSTTAFGQLFKPLDVLGLQLSGCNYDRQGELIFLYTGCGFAVDSLVINLDSTYGVYSNRNDYFINKKGEVCKWKPGDLTVFEECDNLHAAGAGDHIPPGSIVIIQMTADIGTISSLKGECDLDIPIYVIANDCIRTDEAFPIHGVRKDSFGIEILLLPDFRWEMNRFYVAYTPDPTIFDRPLWLQATYPGEWDGKAVCDTHHIIDFSKHIRALYPDLRIDQPSCQTNGSIEFPFVASQYSINGGLAWSTDSIFSDLEPGTYLPAAWDDQANCPVVWPYPITIDTSMTPEFLTVWWFPLPDTICQGRTANIYIDFIVKPSGGRIDTTLYEFSIDSGQTFQDSWIFPGVVKGGYHLAIREKAHPECVVHHTFLSPHLPELKIIGLAHDSIGFCGDGRVEILATGEDLLYSLDGISYHFDPFVVLQPGVPYTVYVKEEGNDRCIDSLEVILHQAPEFIPEVIVTGQSAEFLLLAESKGPYKLLWSTGDTTATVTGLPAGINHLEITDGWGCKQTYAFIVTENTCVFQITDSIVDATCETPTTSIYLNNMDTLNTYTYDWSEDSFDGLPYVENVPHGTYTVEISYGECSKKIEFTTPIGGIERIEINTQAAGCRGIGNIILEKVTGGQGPYTIDITGEQFDSSLQIMGLSSGIYPFLITDVKGCQFRDTVEIISDGSMPVVTPKARVDCETSIYSLDFSEIDGGTPPYYLLFEEYNDADFLIENLQPGTYKYQILDAAGCDSRITEIQLFEIPEVMIANRDTFIVPGDPIYLSAFVDTSIFRDFDWMNEYRDICDHCLDTIYENAEEGTYFFTYDFKLFDGSNCERTHRFRVRYLQDKIYIPNAFSPNSDNVNDLFEIYAPNHEVVNLQIYNRWGDQIFSSAGPDFQWNGQVGSTKAEQGVYVYQVLLKSSNGKTQWESGSITLIR